MIQALIDGDVVAMRAATATQRKCTCVELYDLENREVSTIYFDSLYKKKDILKWLLDNNISKDSYNIKAWVDLQPEHYALHNVNRIMETIKIDTNTTNFKVYLTRTDGVPNFRFNLAKLVGYKANRPPKPIHLKKVREYLITKYGAELVEGMEADDKLGIEQTKHNYFINGILDSCGSIICSNDKDMNNIPGNHYNIAKRTIKFVSPDEAIRHFYMQVLTGDRIDNIPGLKGIGPVKAGRIIGNSIDPKELFDKCYQAYSKAGRAKDIYEIAKLCWIMQKKGQIWSPP